MLKKNGISAMNLEELQALFEDFSGKSALFTDSVKESVGIDNKKYIDEWVKDNIETYHVFFKKWTAPILLICKSYEGAVRFSYFQKVLPEISANSLSYALEDLEARHLIKREILDSKPPGVEYSLTEEGRIITEIASPLFLYVGIIKGYYKDIPLRLGQTTK